MCHSLDDIHVRLIWHCDNSLAFPWGVPDVPIGLTGHIVSVTAHQSHLAICNGHVVLCDDSLAHGDLAVAWGAQLLPVVKKLKKRTLIATYEEVAADAPRLIGTKLPSLDASSWAARGSSAPPLIIRSRMSCVGFVLLRVVKAVWGAQ